jgi:glycosyltransferase involved in cell wall biosynthesis
VLVTTFWSYKDALVQTYTLPYLKIMHRYLPPGSVIYLLTLEQPRFKVNPADWPAEYAALAQHGIRLIHFPYFPYGLRSLLNWGRIVLFLWWLVMRKGVQTIHSFCTPAALAGYLLSMSTGRRLIMDSYEPHAEASVENGDWARDSFRFRLLFGVERLASRRAALVISATEGMRHYAREKYGVIFKRFYVKPACVDLALFSERNLKKPDLVTQLGLADKIVAVYAGKFGGIYLDKEVFDLLRVAQLHWGDRLRVLVLTSHSPDQVAALAQASGLDPAVVITQFVPHAHIADYLGLADFALTPVKPIPTKRYCTPIKNGEYWALGLPVVITPQISDDSEIIDNEEIGAIMNHFDDADYARVVARIDQLLSQPRAALYQKIRAVAERYRSFLIAEQIYREVYGPTP